MKYDETDIVVEVDGAFRREWTGFVEAHPHGSFFQTPLMFDLVEATNRWEPVVVAARRSGTLSGILVGVIQREHTGPIGALSARTVVWGGPLVDRYDDPNLDTAGALLSGLVDAVRRRSIYVEVRNMHDMNDLRPQFEKYEFTYLDRLNFLVAAQDVRQARQRLSGSKKRQINKSLRAGAEIVEPADVADVREFYDILSHLYRTRVRKPLPDWSFFESFYRIGRDRHGGTFLLVRHEGRIVGGMMCPIFGRRTIYEWYVCGLDREFRDVYPSVLATWAAIEYSGKNGIATFDFMGAGRPDDDYGVREFKSKFGGEKVCFGRFLHINKPLAYRIGELGMALLQRGAGKPGF